MKVRVADKIMDTLVGLGIDTCFGVVGGGAMFLDDALRKCEGMRKVFNHHEQASAMAAEGYARLCGRPALVCVTCGPGATNTLTGVMGAWEDSIPMVVVSGQVRYPVSVPESGLDLRYRGIQEYQVIPAVKHMTKYAVSITDPKEVVKEIHKAYNIAMDGRRGPIWIEVPQDMQSAMVEEDEFYPAEPYSSDIPLPDPGMLKGAAGLLADAKRPCILTGSGVRSSGLMDEFYEFIEAAGIPFVGAAWVSDSGYDEHPLYYGLSGNIGPRTGNFILQNADVILVLGNSLGYRQTGFNNSGFAPNARIIMVDACEDEARKPGLNIHTFIHCDLKRFFEAFKQAGCRIEADEKWMDYCNGLKKRFTAFEGAEGKSPDEAVSSYVFWKEF
nr:thiamine pyrophosphate-binding protein [Lachnospiraceae bacterium]